MTDSQILLLADIVLVIHFTIAGYLALGLPVIWIGRMLGWQFIHNPWFRYSHAGLMGVVLFESLVGIFCPLTAWEGALRRAAGQHGAGQGESFVSHWFGKILFHEFNDTAYTVAYGLFFVLVVLTLLLVPVRKKRKKMPNKQPN
ncbi:DUF2784 domain-containing protein [uncultured Pseudodesulfovibrio sp.]|uniref:DUF2784 domain-containing protein n=1 Tax=uncultured Pseudodesulfovibrio sp. TaxID=2035858 RepID=UPI0029C8B7BE|nr:DUF2784 domain-containing protein [uncultured Pseudodesulfovibrio sp.]